MSSRLTWAKFGRYNEATVTVDHDVQMEFIIGKKKTELPCSYFVNKAKYYEFPDNVIREIARADDYEKVYDTYYNRALDDAIECLRRARDISSEHRGPSERDARLKSDKSESELPITGLRQMLNAKKKESCVETPPLREVKKLSCILDDCKEQGKVAARRSKLVLRNVPLEFVERDIYDELADFDVTNVFILRRAQYDGCPKESIGTAFVTFINEKEAKDCLEYMNGVCWEHNVVSAEMMDEKDSK